MIYRMSAAFLSLAGLFLSGYLYLYKIGKIGSLACGTGGCETVQLSPWSRFAGLEVSLIGVLGYAGLLALSLASLQAGASWQWPVRAMAVAAGIGVVFTLYLTYLELFVIHAICRWCVASGVIILAIFVAVLLDQRRQSRARVS
jgi:uncharacterized membrane protein